MPQTPIPSMNALPAVCVTNSAMPACRIRQWELVEFAGNGSLANVYRARPEGARNEQQAAYAIKMLRTCWENDSAAIRLLQREALVSQTVSNPHLISILGAYVLESPRLLVMPWLDGMTLAKRMSLDEVCDIPKALWLARQTAEALDALHTAGWMHGDVTPDNIFMSPTGHATLFDLSFARRPLEFSSVVDRPVMGTCGYLAPECITSVLQPDIRSDIFSLGAILYEIFTGRRPYLSEKLPALASEQRQSTPPDIKQLAPQIPREVANLVRRMISKNPMRRPQTPRELLDQLIGLEIATFSHRA